MSETKSFDAHWRLVKKTARKVEVRGKEYEIPEDLPLSYALLGAQIEELEEAKPESEEEVKWNMERKMRLLVNMQNEAMNYFFGPEVLAEWSRDGMGQKEFYQIFAFVTGIFYDKADDEDTGDADPKEKASS